jgi:hypothetical protein
MIPHACSLAVIFMIFFSPLAVKFFDILRILFLVFLLVFFVFSSLLAFSLSFFYSEPTTRATFQPIPVLNRKRMLLITELAVLCIHRNLLELISKNYA